MGNFSVSPSEVLAINQDKGYVGLWIEQGVPILDRDLNLMQDLIAAAVRSLAARYIGDGIAASTDGFAIRTLVDNQNIHNFAISAGTCLVGGVEVMNRAEITYNTQTGVPPLTRVWSPPSGGSAEDFFRIDVVYLDAFPEEVDNTLDPDLNNSLDVGMQTSTRLKTTWVVRVAEGVRFRHVGNGTEVDGVPLPTPPVGHTFSQLAEFWTWYGEQSIEPLAITDLRQRRLTLADLERRVRSLETSAPTFAPRGWQFRPQSGASGSQVRLSGKNFDQGNLKVYFEDSAAFEILFITATEIELKVPNVGGILPRTIKIMVVTDSGQVTSDDDFTVTRL